MFSFLMVTVSGSGFDLLNIVCYYRTRLNYSGGVYLEQDMHGRPFNRWPLFLLESLIWMICLTKWKVRRRRKAMRRRKKKQVPSQINFVSLPINTIITHKCFKYETEGWNFATARNETLTKFSYFVLSPSVIH